MLTVGQGDTGQLGLGEDVMEKTRPQVILSFSSVGTYYRDVSQLLPELASMALLEIQLPFAGGELYSGTVADFSGSDPLILKREFRTDQYDAKQLNGKFVEVT